MDGILIINKPKEYTSHDVVAIVKKKTKERVGHTGTLDPNATGVLPLLIGKATRISKYLIQHDKTYQAILELGIQTSTQDAQGEIIQQQIPRKYTIQEIKQVLESLQGEQEQTPPIYSAIKIKGKKLYEYARKKQEVEIPKRKITIYQIRLLDYKEQQISYEVSCSKGTYIRSLCVEIANKLNTIGYMKELKRTQVGQFYLESAIHIETLKNETIEQIGTHIITIEEFFKKKEKIVLQEEKKMKFLNGVKLPYEKAEEVYRIYDSKNCFLGLGTIENGRLKRDVILEEN